MPQYEVQGVTIRESQFRYRIWADDEEQAVARAKLDAEEFGEWDPAIESVQLESVEEVK